MQDSCVRSFPEKDNRSRFATREDQKLKNMKKWRLIIRNLPFQVKEEELRNVLQPYGLLQELQIPQKFGRAAGFAFAQFRKFPDAYQAMMKLNGTKVGGRAVAIDWAMPKDNYLTAVLEEKSKEVATNATERLSQSKQQKGDLQKNRKRRHNDEDAEDSSASGNEDGDSDKEGSSGNENEDLEADATESDENETEDESETDDENENSDRTSKGKTKQRPEVSRDVEEGRTLFIRNLSFDTTSEKLQQHFEQFGPLKYGLVCRYPETDHSKGTGFVQFVDKNSADECVGAYEKNERDARFLLDNRHIVVCRAISRKTVVEIEKKKHEKQPKDNRNLHLLRISLIRPGSQEAKGMSESDANKRLKIEGANRQKLANLNIFVSPTRICIHNIPRRVDDKELMRICKEAIDHDPTARMKECRIMRDMRTLDADGKTGRSLGFGFVQFLHHQHALACLKSLNNNPCTFADDKRPIVEFSLENRAALNKRLQRLEKSKAALEAKRQKAADDKEGAASLNTEGAGSVPRKRGPRSLKGGETPKDTLLELTTAAELGSVRLHKGMKPLPSHMGPKIRHKKRQGDSEGAKKKQEPPGKKPKGKLSRKHVRMRKRDKLVEKHVATKPGFASAQKKPVQPIKSGSAKKQKTGKPSFGVPTNEESPLRRTFPSKSELGKKTTDKQRKGKNKRRIQ